MEVCFVDVGQGSSGIILLGGRRAIVIDAGGQQSLTVIRVLQQFQIDAIERLFITHNHADHSRGAVELLTAYSRRIEQIWFIYDDVLMGSLFWKRVTEEVKADRLRVNQIRRLEREDRPRVVYKHNDTFLHIIAPTFLQNLQGVEDQDANSTSGILLFSNKGSSVVFSGDSTIPEWESVNRLKGTPIKCDVFTVPHHAGGVWEAKKKDESQATFDTRVRDALDWLYSKAVNAKYGIVSVGTNNSYQHPRPEVMAALRRAGTVPLCTQITEKCSDDLEAHRKKSLPIILPSRSVLREDVNQSNRSRNVPCASTILVELRNGSAVIQRFADHQAMIDRMMKNQITRPLCRN